MHLNEIINRLKSEFPIENALQNDRVGLQVKGDKDTVSNILVAYELDSYVVSEASALNTELIIAFHPLIYRPLTQIIGEDRVSRIVKDLLKNDISLYIIHTNFDTHINGTNFLIACELGLINTEPLVPSEPGKNNPIGLVGELHEPLETEDFAQKISEIFRTQVRYCNGRENLIRKVAVIGGSGSSFYDYALASGADAYITADVTYHTFHQAKDYLSLFDIGHYEMERFNKDGMKKLIENIFAEMQVELHTSRVNTNPVKYCLSKNIIKEKNNLISIN
ncbi:MAG: Nif3-like dinuclear metal center hexameric protein [Candidatus Kapaibacterium sp.]|nr:Nif3-like dinuclear metal center hexameric protein [Candidatus Kapabacteria bacterium]